MTEDIRDLMRAEVANLDLTEVQAALDRVRHRVRQAAAVPIPPERRRRVICVVDGEVIPVGVTESYSVDPETGEVSFTCVRPDPVADTFTFESGDPS